MGRFGKLIVKADRWPWQAKGPYHQSWHGRFGGGWDFKLGIATGATRGLGWTVILDLGLGSIRLNYKTKRSLAIDAARQAAKTKAAS